MRPILLLACALGVAAAAAPVKAQNRQVKPYFLVVFDTSGSMSEPLSSANSCGFTGTSNAMGNPIQTRKIDTAKCVLGKIVNATGDADFGLMQFAQTQCSTAAASAGTCNNTLASAQLRVPITTNTAPAISALIDNVPTVTLPGTGGVARPADELCPGGYTPLGGTLDAAKEYFENGFPVVGQATNAPAPTQGDAALACRPLAVILLTDGAECCSGCQAAWSGCPNAAAATGIACQTNTCGTVNSCQSGGHFESAPERAYELRSSVVPRQGGTSPKDIKTYVIGFGLGSREDRIERIARAGGTDAPGPNYGFYATDEAALSLAFSQIIADSQPPAEECNNEDDDCDSLIDEGIPKFCNKPKGITDPATCEGAADPTVCCDEPEETICDGEDDDCDGLIDEGVLNECGRCGDVPAEACNGIDDDCDDKIDEMTEGGPCGTDEGRCEEGKERCVNGMLECRGEVGPGDETCNCKDDDCDGKIDEDIDGSLCEGSACVACECVPRCEPGAEFMPVCDAGRRPDIQPSGECLCVIDNCDAPACAKMTLEREDEVACAPNDPTVAPCLCRAGMCAARCDGVTCASGQVCNPRNGKCTEDNCRGFGCADGKICDALEAECVTDACADADCGAGKVCRGGTCETSCAEVTCEVTERCTGGRCVDDPCANVRCDRNEVCDPDSAECVQNTCSQSCPQGLVCNGLSGKCERNPCWDVECPEGQRCDAGECGVRTGAPPAGGSSGSGNAGDPNVRVLAAGGGGCTCNVALGGRNEGAAHGSGWLLALGTALLFGVRLRRSRALLSATAALVITVLLGGCDVSPFCIDCVDAGTTPPRAGTGNGSGGSSGRGNGGGTGGTMADGGPDGSAGSGGDATVPLCRDRVAETCDGKDQDCDFKVDEEVEAEDNDCVQDGVCEGSRPVCLNGEFECRYPDAREEDETLCDGLDNDCDNKTDETFDNLGDDCDIGVGACKTQGKFVCDETMKGVRCEGEAGEPQDEVCDGIDNDCDTLIDEPKSASDDDHPSYVEDDLVQVDSDLWVYRYEASRPDASETKQGMISTRACSRAAVLPWTNITYDEAADACEAADMALCTVAEWKQVCQGGSSCAWSFVPATPANATCPAGQTGYPATASPTNKDACNGHNLMAAPGSADTDTLAATGAYPRCYTLQGAEQVFDLSGNAKEWVTGPNSGAASDPSSPLLGGSFNNLPGGMRCDFEFAAAKNAVRLRNIGFRCCTNTAP